MPYPPPPGHGQPPPGYGGQPEVRYEASAEDSRAAFSAMPPPANLDASSGKGRGKGKGKWDDSSVISDGVNITNLPAELNSLDALHRHFRRFGEILKITTDLDNGSAFVQFADRGCPEAAVGVPLYDRPEVVLTLSQRTRGGGKGGGKGGGGGCKGKIQTADGRPAENRVLVCDTDEHARVVASKRKKDETDSMKAKLLGTMTDQLRMIMSRLTAEGLDEEKKASYRTLMLQIKGKIDALNGIVADDGRPDAPKQAKGKAKGKEEWQSTGRWTLDLRTRVLKADLPEGWTIEKLREEVKKTSLGEDTLQELVPEGGEPGAAPEAVLLRFKDRASAEHVFNQKGDLAFRVEWSDKPFPETAPSGVPAPTVALEDASASAAPQAPAAAAAATIAAKVEEELPAWDEADDASALPELPAQEPARTEEPSPVAAAPVDVAPVATAPAAAAPAAAEPAESAPAAAAAAPVAADSAAAVPSAAAPAAAAAAPPAADAVPLAAAPAAAAPAAAAPPAAVAAPAPAATVVAAPAAAAPVVAAPAAAGPPPAATAPAAAAAPAGTSSQDLEKLTVVELKCRLKEAGLPVSGNKAELVARLQEGAGAAPS